LGNVINRPIVVVTGTQREAAVLEDNGVEVICGGSDPERLERMLTMVAPNAAGLVSFGMCGAIDRSLRLGQWIIGKRLSGTFHTRSDEAWVSALRGRMPKARVGSIYADGSLLTEQGEKATRSWSSAALAADMESHIVGAVATQFNLPFVMLRCVSDIAEVVLPPAVDVMMGPQGEVDVGAVMRSIAMRPTQLPHLASTISGFAKAYRELIAGAKLFGPRLAFEERMFFQPSP
jgi:adenosylhomocysteine nucleosidase